MRLIEFRYVAILALALCHGCSKNPSAPQSNSAPEKAVSSIGSEGEEIGLMLPLSDCNLQTPLDPGTPGSPSNLITSQINPNGDSELSVLMRKMLIDLRQVRKSILNNQAPLPTIDHRRIMCSWPTEPSIRGNLFERLGNAYLTAFEQLSQGYAPKKSSYNSVVAGCLGCHNHYCPGPIPLIDALWIE